MSSKEQNLSTYKVEDIPNLEGKKIGIVVSEWNQTITEALKQGAIETLIQHGVNEADIQVVYVPGSFELPLGAKMLYGQHSPDGIICIGCVIKGETKHDEYISNAVAGGLMNLNLVANIPVVFGVLTPNTKEQAEDRAGGKYGNKGVEAAVTVLKMIHLRSEIKKDKKSIGFGG